MAAILKSFGYNIYDFEEHFVYHRHYWRRIFDGEAAVPIFKEMYKDVDAIMDMPSYIYWEQVAEAFPEAKVILVERDDEKWVNSLINMFKIIDTRVWFGWRARNNAITGPLLTLLKYSLSNTLGEIRPWFDEVFTLAFGPGAAKDSTYMSRDYMLRLYRAHNAHVRAHCSKERLLIYKMGDGWEPICKHLGVPVPKMDFPHANQKGGIVDDLMDGTGPGSARDLINKEIESRLRTFIVLVGACTALWYKKVEVAAMLGF